MIHLQVTNGTAGFVNAETLADLEEFREWYERASTCSHCHEKITWDSLLDCVKKYCHNTKTKYNLGTRFLANEIRTSQATLGLASTLQTIGVMQLRQL